MLNFFAKQFGLTFFAEQSYFQAFTSEDFTDIF